MAQLVMKFLHVLQVTSQAPPLLDHHASGTFINRGGGGDRDGGGGGDGDFDVGRCGTAGGVRGVDSDPPSDGIVLLLIFVCGVDSVDVTS